MRWVKDLQSSLEMFGWSGLKVEALNGLWRREVAKAPGEEYCMEESS